MNETEVKLYFTNFPRFDMWGCTCAQLVAIAWCVWCFFVPERPGISMNGFVKWRFIVVKCHRRGTVLVCIRLRCPRHIGLFRVSGLNEGEESRNVFC